MQQVGINVLGSLLDLWNCLSNCPPSTGDAFRAMADVPWWAWKCKTMCYGPTSGTGEPPSCPAYAPSFPWGEHRQTFYVAFPIRSKAKDDHPFAEHWRVFRWKMVVENPGRAAGGFPHLAKRGPVLWHCIGGPFISGRASGILGLGLTDQIRPLVTLSQLYLETDTAVSLGEHSQTKLWFHLQNEKQDGLCGNTCCFFPLWMSSPVSGSTS